MNTLNEDEQTLTCRGCGATTTASVDRARAAKWRIPWTPGEAVWCPPCWSPSPSRPPVGQPATYDEPMF